MDINKKTFYTITFGEFISNIGDRFQKIAFPILIYKEFHSSFAMGGMVIIELLPQLLLGFVMGYLLDNFNKKKILLWSTFIPAVLCSLIPLFSKYSVSIFFYYIIAFLLPLFSTLFQTGFSVITPALFEKKELQKYNSQFQGVRTISKLISPALAGLLMLKFNINSIFFINSASFLLLFLSILISYIPNQVKKEDGNDDMKEIFTGFKENFTNIRLRVSLLFTIVVNIAMLGFNATIVYYLQDQLKLSNSLVGLVYSIAGFGSLIAVTILSTYLKKKDTFILMNISMMTIPLVIMASGIVENWIFFGICYSILSGLITIASVSITTIQQQESTEYNIGKILSSSFVIATIFAPLGGILAAYFNWLLTPRFSFVILGLLSSLFVIFIKKYEKNLKEERRK
ncbi:MFS transporter [Streptococcus suis]|uniref:MFS transporter n=3 Tax=Streptococcus TaxID=1301 RepID=UPI00041CB99A|nr:MFS transporter [Streptococcus suis]ASW51702.1 permease [Streptococcus suis]MBS8078371.1 MFS transporter [Streptococcus suis]MCK3965565.1 MFS transporter [Streptococcus suis]NQM10726.1 MFS transporter [Streptococcus suis]NQM44123.1 MFS transporter [Streptococcus suis]